ncbi:helix-turn-helix transcriptional regulator [Streptomyces sp. NPDC050844]|uniref:helix-turn-helix transcriptional regulator n=1 Tax=Streptomyces sp. NPDC050844 TaxID=3155790 RepID=UPI0033CA02FE
MYRLVRRDLLRMLMQRTRTGAPVAIRELASVAGVSRSTIGHLLTGQRRSVPLDTAHAIAQHIGVELLVLFVPVGRSQTETRTSETPAHASASTSHAAQCIGG